MADWDRDIEADRMRSAMAAQLEQLQRSGDGLMQEYRVKAAKALIGCGMQLIPSDTLRDGQFVVSRGVYDAAIELCDL